MVNTFIIVPDIVKTAQLLDTKRLGKQRIEALEIINCLEEFDKTGKITSKWGNHPVVKCWMGFTNHLKVYYNIILREWINRGYNNNMEFYQIENENLYHIVPCNFHNNSIVFCGTYNYYSFPFWVAFYPFYMSHQASLCRKYPKYYSSLLREELNYFLEIGYFWPCNYNYNQNNLPYTNWNYTYHEKIGCGAPPIYRHSLKDCIRWFCNKEVNPVTGRRIRKTSDIYKNYEQALADHGVVIHNNGAITYLGKLTTFEELTSMRPKTITELVYQNAFS